MLGHLFELWSRYENDRWKVELEIGQWTSQHCLDADDFAFGLAMSMLQTIRDRVEVQS